MRYVKAAVVGSLSASAAAFLYVALKWMWAALYLQLVLVPQARARADFGSWSAQYPQRFDLRAPLVVGFALGVVWMMRRQRVHRSTR